MPTPRTHARSVSTCEILSLTLIIQDDEYRLFGVLCMAYMSPSNDVSQAASNQSCNGRDGAKLECKESKKV